MQEIRIRNSENMMREQAMGMSFLLGPFTETDAPQFGGKWDCTSGLELVQPALAACGSIGLADRCMWGC